MAGNGSGAGKHYEISADFLIKRPGKITNFDIYSGVADLITRHKLQRKRKSHTEPKISLNDEEFHRNLDVYEKKAIRDFLKDVTRMYTIGDGSCAVHAVFGSMSSQYREVDNEKYRDQLIALAETFRQEILVDFYQRGWMTRRINSRGEGRLVSNDTFIQDRLEYLEDIDIRKISEVCHINIILISFFEDRETKQRGGYTQFISGLEVITEDNRELLHEDWPIILMYNTGEHYETCKYQPNGFPGRYILDYSELSSDLLKALIPSKEERIVQLESRVDGLKFLLDKPVKILGRSDGPWKVCAIDIYTTADGKHQYISGLRLENISRKIGGVYSAAGIVPLHFIDFSGISLSKEEKAEIGKAIGDFSKIDMSQAPGGLFRNDANLGGLISEPRVCPPRGPAPFVKRNVDPKNIPPQPAPAGDAKFYAYTSEEVDDANTTELIDDIEMALSRFDLHVDRKEITYMSNKPVQRPPLNRKINGIMDTISKTIKQIRTERKLGVKPSGNAARAAVAASSAAAAVAGTSAASSANEDSRRAMTGNELRKAMAAAKTEMEKTGLSLLKTSNGSFSVGDRVKCTTTAGLSNIFVIEEIEWQPGIKGNILRGKDETTGQKIIRNQALCVIEKISPLAAYIPAASSSSSAAPPPPPPPPSTGKKIRTAPTASLLSGISSLLGSSEPSKQLLQEAEDYSSKVEDWIQTELAKKNLQEKAAQAKGLIIEMYLLLQQSADKSPATIVPLLLDFPIVKKNQDALQKQINSLPNPVTMMNLSKLALLAVIHNSKNKAENEKGLALSRAAIEYANRLEEWTRSEISKKKIFEGKVEENVSEVKALLQLAYILFETSPNKSKETITDILFSMPIVKNNQSVLQPKIDALPDPVTMQNLSKIIMFAQIAEKSKGQKKGGRRRRLTRKSRAKKRTTRRRPRTYTR